MNGPGGPADNKVLTSGPKTRMCHICGRQYGLNSFEIHLKQCKDLWIAREALKDKSERKPVPRDPSEGGGMSNSGSVAGIGSGSINSAASTGGAIDLAEINRLASETYNTVSLSVCANCGRSFLNEKLLIHNRSCTPENPARRVAAREPSAAEAEKEPPKNVRPKSSMRRPLNSSSSADNIGDDSSNSNNNSPKVSPTKPALTGHLGGSAGRQLRASNGENGSSGNGDDGYGGGDGENGGNSPKKGVSIRTSDSAGDTIFELSKRVDAMEGVVRGLVGSISEVKGIIAGLMKNQGES